MLFIINKDKIRRCLAGTVKRKRISFAALFVLMLGCSYMLGNTAPGVTGENAISTFSEGNWGLVFHEEGKRPEGNAEPEELRKYDAYFVKDTDEKVIYLTFDAGYENGNTEPILDALKKHNAKGCFFVVGNYIDKAPELVKRMVKEGHNVGNHTMHHPDMSKLEEEDFRKELTDLEDRFRDVTGEELKKFYRPPQGRYSIKNLRTAKQMGYKTIFWSLAYVDWQQNEQPGKEEAFSKLIPRIHPGAIVLLHSTSGTNADILDELLTKWEDMGYRFEPLQGIAS